MELGGVETGSRNEVEQESVTGMMTASGLRCNAVDMAASTGVITDTTATLDIS